MNRQTVSMVILVVAQLAVAACGGEPAGSGGAQAICQRLIDSPQSCSEECNTARAAAGSECSAEFAAFASHAEANVFGDCILGCPNASTCGERVDAECGCAAECLRARSADLQVLFEDFAACSDLVYEGACY